MAISKAHAAKSEGRFTKIARTFSRNGKITVRLHGTGCYTNNISLINLPANADYLTEATQDLLEGMLDHEMGHVTREQEAREKRAAGDLSWPLPSEAMKAARSKKERFLINVFEDIALEVNASKRYVGMGDNLRDLNKVMFERLEKAGAAGKLSPWKALTCGIIAKAHGWEPKFIGAAAPLLAALSGVIERSKAQTEHVGHTLARVAETMAIIKDFAEEPEEGDDTHKGDTEEAPEDKKPEPKKPEDKKPEQAKEPKEPKHEEKQGEKSEEGEEGEEKPEEKGSESEEGEGKDEEHEDGSSEEGEEEGGEEESTGSGEEGSGSEEGEEGEEEGKGEESKDAQEGEDSADSSGDAAGEDEGEAGGEDGEEGEGTQDSTSGDEDGKPEGEPEPESEGTDDPAARSFAQRLRDEEADAEHSTEDLEKDLEKEARGEMKANRRHYPHPDVLALDDVYVPADTSDAQYQAELAEVKPVVAGLRSRLLQYLRAQQATSPEGDKESGALDASALYSLRFNNKRIFTTQTAAPEINTAIAILVDMSGSMRSQNKDETARAAVMAVSEALNALNVPFAVYGFDNQGRVGAVSEEDRKMYNRFDALRMRAFKTFEDNFKKVRTRLCRIIGHGNNSDGDAVQFMLGILRRRPEGRKILLVLSDGQPACDCASVAALHDHLREMVTVEATRAGVEVFGLGIKDETVKAFYPDFDVVHNLPDLPKVMFQMLRKYLTKPLKVARGARR